MTKLSCFYLLYTVSMRSRGSCKASSFPCAVSQKTLRAPRHPRPPPSLLFTNTLKIFPFNFLQLCKTVESHIKALQGFHTPHQLKGVFSDKCPPTVFGQDIMSFISELSFSFFRKHDSIKGRGFLERNHVTCCLSYQSFRLISDCSRDILLTEKTNGQRQDHRCSLVLSGRW